jgi:WD40 repeat protein
LDKPFLAYNNHTERINSIDISHDCKMLLSSSSDKTCKLWSTKKNELLLDIQSIKETEKKVYITIFILKILEKIILKFIFQEYFVQERNMFG